MSKCNTHTHKKKKHEHVVQKLSAEGVEERVFSLLVAKAQKRLQSLVAGHEGIPLLTAVPCEEDAMSKEDIVAEDRKFGP